MARPDLKLICEDLNTISDTIILIQPLRLEPAREEFYRNKFKIRYNSIVYIYIEVYKIVDMYYKQFGGQLARQNVTVKDSHFNEIFSCYGLSLPYCPANNLHRATMGQCMVCTHKQNP